MNFQFSGNKFVKSMKAQKSMKLVKILLLSTGPGRSLLSWLLQHSERQKTKKWQYFKNKMKFLEFDDNYGQNQISCLDWGFL